VELRGYGRVGKTKVGYLAKEAIFIKTITDNFTPYYNSLIPLLNGLRRIAFPGDKPWEREDESVYSRIREILRKERKDLEKGSKGEENG
jgi:hypothetical protein